MICMFTLLTANKIFVSFTGHYVEKALFHETLLPDPSVGITET
jgi:hypothetical protein